MFWQRKKGMIDVGAMAKRGQIILPKKGYEIPTNKEGFVEVNSTLSEIQEKKFESQSEKKENQGFFDFLGFGNSSNTAQSTNSSNNSFPTELNGYNKREVDVKIEELDNKIYKLEQRIEVLERKTGVGSWG